MKNRLDDLSKIIAVTLGSILVGWVAFVATTHLRKENLRPISGTQKATSLVRPPSEDSAAAPSKNALSERAASFNGSLELKMLAKAVQKSLPDRSIFKSRSAEEVHHTPAEILEAGRKLGTLAEYLEAHPDEVPAALPTYVDCALNTKTMESIRALCTYRLEVYSSNWDERTRSAYAKVPESIRNLASRLNSH